MFTDASGEGYGGFVLKHLSKEICTAKFDIYEEGASSTFRELLAVLIILIITALLVFYQLVIQNHAYKILLKMLSVFALDSVSN